MKRKTKLDPARLQMRATLSHCFKVVTGKLEAEANAAELMGDQSAARRLRADAAEVKDRAPRWGQ